MAKNTARDIWTRLKIHNAASGITKGNHVITTQRTPLMVRAHQTLTAGTSFLDPALSGYGDDFFIDWRLVFIVNNSGTSNYTRGVTTGIVTDSADSGLLTFATLGANLVVGDEFVLIPPEQSTSQLVESVQTPDASATTWTQTAHRLFTVTGEVLIHAIFGVVDEALTGAANGSVGVSGSAAGLINTLVGMAANLNAVNDIWVGRASSTGSRYIGVQDAGDVIVSDVDIDLTITTADVTNGQITFYVVWSPVSANGNVAAAVWD